MCHWIALAGLVLGGIPSSEGAVEVSPALVEIGSGQSWADLTVSNGGAGTSTVRALPLAWSQDPDGRVVLGQASDLAIFPAEFTLAPGASRRVRVSALREAGPGSAHTGSPSAPGLTAEALR